MPAETFTTAELDSTERLAEVITREQYAAGEFDIAEFERRIAYIIGVHGPTERARVLYTADVVDITYFGSPAPMRLASAWRWPE